MSTGFLDSLAQHQNQNAPTREPFPPKKKTTTTEQRTQN